MRCTERVPEGSFLESGGGHEVSSGILSGRVTPRSGQSRTVRLAALWQTRKRRGRAESNHVSHQHLST